MSKSKKTQKEVVAVVKQLGRKVDPNSARQKRLAELKAKREAGECKQGRPVDKTSNRQKRLAELEAKRKAGTLKRGRPAKVEAVVVTEKKTKK